MFSCFFAAFAVLAGQTAGGPHGSELFNLRNVAIETGYLLMSSFVCGMASIAAEERNALLVPDRDGRDLRARAGIHLAIEFREFADAGRARGPGRAAAHFLVGVLYPGRLRHGLHVSAGILWLLTMMAQVFSKGISRRHPAPLPVFCILFWHALDIIWVAVFSVVYLLGSGAHEWTHIAP